MPTKKEKKPLSVTHPELAKEADGWDPSSVTAGINRILPWKCTKSHFWSASVFRRAQGAACPICSNRKIEPGFNDFASTHPELLRLGEPLHVVAKRLGHRDAMVTATIYAHVSSEQSETASSRFANAVSGNL